MSYYTLARKFLFSLSPEMSHAIALKSLKFFYYCGLLHFISRKKTKPHHLLGLNFPNRVGLAAGLDKNGDYIDALAALGFGFIEVGTITPRPQPGNPKPRLFRLAEQEAIINRLGFNNRGVDYLVSRLKQMKFNGILGINIGKNRDTPLEKSLDDYLICLRKVYPYASYVTINISSPNTAGLRDLQHSAALQHLLQHLKHEQTALAARYGKHVPLLVKIAPDLSDSEIAAMAKIFLENKIDGIIATNTTLDRSAISGAKQAEETGGLSGVPMLTRATAVVQQLSQHLENKIPIIAVGGIMSSADMKTKLAAGASLVQIYTGFIYKGPHLIQELLEGDAE